jgi:predicted alpha/beta superfamily hydrolase
MIIAGYSLGGLFSLYSLYETDVFTRAVSASGSMWFPGFWEYVNGHEMKAKPERIYMSLGDQEAKSKNPYLCTVQEKTEAIYKHFEEIGLPVKYELNPGNHFQNADERLAKGIAWCLQD